MIYITLLSCSVRLAAAVSFREWLMGDSCGPKDKLDMFCVVFSYLTAGVIAIVLAALAVLFVVTAALYLTIKCIMAWQWCMRSCRWRWQRSSRRVSGTLDAVRRDAGCLVTSSQQDRKRA